MLHKNQQNPVKKKTVNCLLIKIETPSKVILNLIPKQYYERMKMHEADKAVLLTNTITYLITITV